MLEKWKNAVDKRKCFEALPTDLFKTFTYFSQEMLIAELHAYGFELPAIKLIQSLPIKQKTKVQNQSDA